jgi:hypothetical protein
VYRRPGRGRIRAGRLNLSNSSFREKNPHATCQFGRVP